MTLNVNIADPVPDGAITNDGSPGYGNDHYFVTANDTLDALGQTVLYTILHMMTLQGQYSERLYLQSWSS